MIERTERVWIEQKTVYTTDELAHLSGLPRPVVEDLIGCGALPATGADAADGAVVVETECVVLARAAVRLREHFELDASGLAVAVSLLRRVRLLEARIATLGAPRDG